MIQRNYKRVITVLFFGGNITPMTTKQLIARAVGAAAVGVVGVFVLKQGLGAAAEASALGSFALLVVHEMLDAPVSDWVYRQI
jgi:hypothetical protein